MYLYISLFYAFCLAARLRMLQLVGRVSQVKGRAQKLVAALQAVHRCGACMTAGRDTVELEHAVQVMVGKHMLVDPTQAEEALASGRVIIAMDSQRQQVAHLDVEGVFEAEPLRDAMGLALAACSESASDVRACLAAAVQKRLHAEQEQAAAAP
jgi:exosome complex RNA-binding protein Rrp42 (RNase PH superfamily)